MMNEWKKCNPIARFKVLISSAERRDITVEKTDAKKLILKMVEPCYYCGSKPSDENNSKVICMKTKINNIC